MRLDHQDAWRQLSLLKSGETLRSTESEDEKDKLQVYYYTTHMLMEGQHNNDDFVSDLRWRVRSCIYN